MQEREGGAALAPGQAVLVVGAGAMGRGIALVAASAGHLVFLSDVSEEARRRALTAIAEELDGGVRKGRMSAEEASAIRDRIRAVAEPQSVASQVHLVIEAIVEDLEVKRVLFASLEPLVPPQAILATNTSSLSITAIAAPLARPERVVGMHFFNPPTRMKLVEVVSGLATAPEVAQAIRDTAVRWGKIAVMARSTPGFIVNRVARPFYAEALRVLAEGAADCATLDAIVREAGGFPMGPFELMDLIGHDVNFAVTSSVWSAYFYDKRFQPSLIQQELVWAGRLGRKSGRGFYDYAAGAQRPAAAEAPSCLDRAPSAVAAVGEFGPFSALLERLAAAGVVVHRRPADAGPVRIEAADVWIVPTDGRTATRLAHEYGHADVVVLDWARDWAQTPRAALARADGCAQDSWACALGLLQRAGIAVTPLDDVAGLILARTVAMLANEAADAVLAGIGTPRDIDTAMRYGTNYPLGPLAWGEATGVARIVGLLDRLAELYGEDRYRVSPLLRRHLWNGRPLASGDEGERK
jgi:3-hydroxybutyryl-CoA dehydrogenase